MAAQEHMSIKKGKDSVNNKTWDFGGAKLMETSEFEKLFCWRRGDKAQIIDMKIKLKII